jgi:L-ascorbate metabolism protein UlaG (beta-lactamase superfamily)
VLVDGFFSRPGLIRFALMPLTPHRCRVEAGLAALVGAGRLRAVLVAHAHHDHAMDAGLIGELTGAVVFGDEDTTRLLGAAHRGLAVRTPDSPDPSARSASDSPTGERPAPVRPDPDSFGPFSVTAFPTAHSQPNYFPGKVAPSPPRRPRAWDMRTHHSLLFHIHHGRGSVLVVPSVAALDGMPDGLETNVVFLSIASLEKLNGRELRAYWCDAVVRTGARAVIAVHWDNLFEPLRPGRTLGTLPDLSGGFDRAVVRLAALAREDRIALTALEPVSSIDISRARALPPPDPEAHSRCDALPAPSAP